MMRSGGSARSGSGTRVLPGVDIVGDRGDLEPAAQRLAQRVDQRRLARADRAADADPKRTAPSRRSRAEQPEYCVSWRIEARSEQRRRGADRPSGGIERRGRPPSAARVRVPRARAGRRSARAAPDARRRRPGSAAKPWRKPASARERNGVDAGLSSDGHAVGAFRRQTRGPPPPASLPSHSRRPRPAACFPHGARAIRLGLRPDAQVPSDRHRHPRAAMPRRRVRHRSIPTHGAVAARSTPGARPQLIPARHGRHAPAHGCS